MESTRVKNGDVIRLYGFSGTFTVSPTSSKFHDFYATRTDLSGCGGRIGAGFPALYSSVVEINGQPVPMLSAPISPPALDYPHEPQFSYSDGPQSLGDDALEMWRGYAAMQTTTLHGQAVVMVRKASWGNGPYDTHLAWGAIGMRFGELIAAHRGLANKLYFIWDSARPATPVIPAQLADIGHLAQTLATF